VPLITTAEGELFYARRGERGPALLCVHGAGGTHAHWGYQLRDLAGVAHVFTLDLPGHGRSPMPGRAGIAGYGAAVLALMDAIGLERAALAGHSMGGAIALWLALERPERVAGLGLIGTGARLRVAPAILAGFDGDLAANIRTIVDYSYAPSAPPEMRARAEQAYALCDPVVYRGDYLACDGLDVLARLPEIRCPVEVIVGAEDRMTPPRHSEALRGGLLGARLTLVPDAGHMVLIERPAAVTEALRELVLSLSQSR
jgi:pimeloyl-ACP methyl ester carboxylesterase